MRWMTWRATSASPSQRGSLIQYSVPYSEHSSFEELRELVGFLAPRAILPHVGNDRGPRAAKMVQLLTAPAAPAAPAPAAPNDDAEHTEDIST